MQFSYVQPQLKKVINITEIKTIHYFECDKKFEFSGETHDFWEMVYIDNGMVEVLRDDEILILKQGEIIFHEPGEFHSIKSYQSSPNFLVVSFVCKSAFMNCFRMYRSFLDTTFKSILYSIVNEAASAYHATCDIQRMDVTVRKQCPIGGGQMVKNCMEQLLILLLRKISCQKNSFIISAEESAESSLVNEVKRYIDSKITDKLSAEEICTHFGYSKAYIGQLFRTHCNTSLMKYYRMQKIECAKKMIREKRYNSFEISDKLSFSNPQYFFRVFKRMTGMTPREYDRSLKLK